MSILTFHYSESLARLAPLSFGAGILPADYRSDRDVLTGSPVWGLGISDAPLAPAVPLNTDLDGNAIPPTPADRLDAIYQTAFTAHAAGHDAAIPRGLARDAIRAWARGAIEGDRARWHAFYQDGRAAGLDFEHDTDCPADDDEARNGWKAGQVAASKMVAARHAEELREMARGR